MRYLLIIIWIIPFLKSGATDKKFPVSEIPDSLKKNANAVVRLDETKFIFKNVNSTVCKRHFVVTVLNNNGDRAALFLENYDKLHKVSDIEGALYDKDGNQIKKLKSKDVEDISAVSEMNLMDDNRIKAHHFYYNLYPYTVEYTYDITYNHSYYFPSWVPVKSENFAVQQSIFEVEYPESYHMRYKELNLADKAVLSSEGDHKKLKWSIINQPAIKIPDLFGSYLDMIPIVYIAPAEFQMESFAGKMDSWKDFGEFQYRLNKDRDALPQNVIDKVNALVASATDDQEKIKILYRYLQQNTRYISIQLGIGGWQTFDAAYVASRGYGDCKALTNYMHALLKAANITSYPVLVYAGDDNFAQNRLIADFPSSQFNHVILCVPGERDSTWLECTSSYLPAGYVSGFTANRKALLIKPEGGFLVSTPQYGFQDNQKNRHVKIDVDEDGNAQLKIRTDYTGMRQDDLFQMVKAASPDVVKKYLSTSISLPTYTIDKYQYNVEEGKHPVLKEEIDITASGFATVTGKRIFITPNAVSRYRQQLLFDKDRKFAFKFDNTYQDSDYVEIRIPAGYKVESQVKPVAIQTSFASYRMNCTVRDNVILYQRSFEQYNTQVPVAKQQDIVSFFDMVNNSDKARIVMVKEE